MKTTLRANTRNSIFHSISCSFSLFYPKKLLRPGTCLFSSAGTLTCSLSIEAALCLPLLILAITALLRPIHAMNDFRRMKLAAEASLKDLTVAASLLQPGDKDEPLKDAAALAYVYARVQAVPRSPVLSDPVLTEYPAATDPRGIPVSDMYSYTIRCRLQLLPSIFGGGEILLSNVVSRRAWTGTEGGRGRMSVDEPPGDNGTEEDETTVYVGRTGSKYHLTPSCHYISNVLYSTDAASIGSLRNSGGGHYHPCASCRPGSSGTVYYFSSGTSYHSTSECRAISSYARSMTLSQALSEGRTPCSYCSE